MKAWVTELLLLKGDKKIHPDQLAKEVSVPVFCYRRLADFFLHDFDERVKTLFGTFLANLELEAFSQLAGTHNLYLHDMVRIAEIHRFLPQSPGEIELIQISHSDEMSDSAIVGCLAHEMSHVFLKHSDRVTLGLNLDLEDEANKLAKEWGFEYELGEAQKFLKKMKGGN